VVAVLSMSKQEFGRLDVLQRAAPVSDPPDRLCRAGDPRRGLAPYLGLGVQEPVPGWGSMLQGAVEEYGSTAPWIAIFPGLAIALTVFGFSVSATAV
jgi:hypothetical protein